MGWVTNPQTGQLEWQDGPQPFGLEDQATNEAAGRHNRFWADWFSQWGRNTRSQGHPDNAGPAALAPQNQPATEGPAPLPGLLEYSPEDFGVGGAGPSLVPYTPEDIDYAPERQVNPAYGARTQYMRDRQGRVGSLIDEYRADLDAFDPDNLRWYERLGGMLGEIAAQDDLSMAGRAVAGYLRGERADRLALSEAAMRLGLDEEGLANDLNLAEVAGISGEYDVREGNQRDRYAVDAANVQQRNEAEASNVRNQNQVAVSAYQGNQEIARARYLQAMSELNQQLTQAASMGDTDALGALLGRLPEDMQRQAMDNMRIRGLAGYIQSAGSRAHREMERLAGRRLPRPPRGVRNNPVSIARWYAQNGVPLDSQEVEDSLMPFGAPTE